MMDLEDTYRHFFTNREKVLAFYRNAAIPDNFSAKDQQVHFFNFMSPTLAIQLTDRLERRQDATWEQCVEAFTITPSEPECQE